MRATGSGRLDAEAGEATANQIVTVSSDENIERAAQIMSAFSTAEERHTLGGAIIDELFMEGEDPLLEIDLQTEISDEDPVTALIEAAHRHGARGIIVGCEQHSRLQKAFGTVTSELLKTSPVPVTAVPFHDSTDTARATT
jgi:nucleotide-binding universal stress UspA family protein